MDQHGKTGAVFMEGWAEGLTAGRRLEGLRLSFMRKWRDSYQPGSFRGVESDTAEPTRALPKA